MSTEPLVLLNLVEALGIGLLIGAERERRRAHDASPVPAGIRTFAIASLTGAVSVLAGGELLLATTMVGVFVLTAVAYWRAKDEDVGLTTEIALVMTVLLGGLSIRRPEIAAGVGVVVAILLAAREPLHKFVRSVLTEDELRDGLLLAAATLVVLPVVPDQPMGPYATLNPYALWIVVILVMAMLRSACSACGWGCRSLVSYPDSYRAPQPSMPWAIGSPKRLTSWLRPLPERPCRPSRRLFRWLCFLRQSTRPLCRP